MTVTQSKKSIGAGLIAFFASVLITFILIKIINFASNHFGLYYKEFHGFSYTNLIFKLILIFRHLVCLSALIFIAAKIKQSAISKTGAFILSFITFLYLVNIFLGFVDMNLFGFLGLYRWIIIGLIELVAAAMLFFGIKIWNPVRIAAFGYWVFCFFDDMFIVILNKAIERAAKTYDYSKVDTLDKIFECFDWVGFIISIICVVLCFAWLGTKNKPNFIQHKHPNLI